MCITLDWISTCFSSRTYLQNMGLRSHPLFMCITLDWISGNNIRLDDSCKLRLQRSFCKCGSIISLQDTAARQLGRAWMSIPRVKPGDTRRSQRISADLSWRSQRMPEEENPPATGMNKRRN